MKRLSLILPILFFIYSCQTNDEPKTIEGDLYFKLIDFERMFDLPDSTLTKIEKYVNTVNKDTLNENDRKLFPILEYMVSNQLLRKPYVRIKLDTGEIKMLFIDFDDYEKFNSYKWRKLRTENKKVRIKALVTELQYDSLTSYNTEKLLSIYKIDGETEYEK